MVSPTVWIVASAIASLAVIAATPVMGLSGWRMWLIQGGTATAYLAGILIHGRTYVPRRYYQPSHRPLPRPLPPTDPPLGSAWSHHPMLPPFPPFEPPLHTPLERLNAKVYVWGQGDVGE